MRIILFLICFIPLVSFSQIVVIVDMFEMSDTKKEISVDDIINSISFGAFINQNVLIGATNRNALADYIEDGYNPVQDSLVVAKFQCFIRYYINDFFLLLRSPLSSKISNISPLDRARVGAGYILYDTKDNVHFEVNYNMLLNPNQNGFNKGELNLGLSIHL